MRRFDLCAFADGQSKINTRHIDGVQKAADISNRMSAAICLEKSGGNIFKGCLLVDLFGSPA